MNSDQNNRAVQICCSRRAALHASFVEKAIDQGRYDRSEPILLGELCSVVVSLARCEDAGHAHVGGHVGRKLFVVSCNPDFSGPVSSTGLLHEDWEMQGSTEHDSRSLFNDDAIEDAMQSSCRGEPEWTAVTRQARGYEKEMQ